MDHLAVVHVGGEPIALGDLPRQVGVLHVLVRLGLRALGEALALVEPGDEEPGRPVGREDHLERLHLGLADRLELAHVAELDLDLGAGLELVALRPLAAGVGEMELEPRRAVHVVGAADPDDGAGQLRICFLAVDEQLERGHQPLVVRCHERCPRARPAGLVRQVSPGTAVS